MTMSESFLPKRVKYIQCKDKSELNKKKKETKKEKINKKQKTFPYMDIIPSLKFTSTITYIVSINPIALLKLID